MSDTFDFEVHPDRLAIARLAAGSPLPAWAEPADAAAFVTVSQTRNELSIVCAQRQVPQGVRCERDKVMFGIAGVVPMTTIGLLAGLCARLAEAAVPVFVVSTYDTDYLLVSADRFAAARSVLEAAGHRFVGELPAD
ncbi:MAG: ACT domain-containing protein [Planctomycetota bacterium]